MLNKTNAQEQTKNILKSISNNKFYIKMGVNLLKEKYKMPPSVSTNILVNYKTEIDTLEDKVLFKIMDVLKQVGSEAKINMPELTNYFTEKEIKVYESSEYTENKIQIYPLEIKNCIEVNPGEQWVTTMTAQRLYELNEANTINYNKNTQRNLTQKNVNGKIEYEITLKQKSVNEISKLMKEGRFISNDITLNLNWEDPNLDFYYDAETNCIVVNEGKFDIIDGYHRFRALMKSISLDENFDYNMIVNIVNFDEEKANRFIVQEDKRNKINSSHLKSLDTQNPVYMIVKRLNEDSSSYLCNQIGREDEEGKITFSYLFNWIDICFEIKERKKVIELTKILKNIFNSIIESGKKPKELGFKEIGIIIMCVSLYSDEYLALEKINNKIKNIDKISKENFSRRIVNKRTANIIKCFVEED